MSPTRALHTAIDDCTRMVRKLREEKAELIEALEDCDRAWASWQVGVPPGRPEDILALIVKVRAAIRKVKGETP